MDLSALPVYFEDGPDRRPSGLPAMLGQALLPAGMLVSCHGSSGIFIIDSLSESDDRFALVRYLLQDDLELLVRDNTHPLLLDELGEDEA